MILGTDSHNFITKNDKTKNAKTYMTDVERKLRLSYKLHDHDMNLSKSSSRDDNKTVNIAGMLDNMETLSKMSMTSPEPFQPQAVIDQITQSFQQSPEQLKKGERFDALKRFGEMKDKAMHE